MTRTTAAGATALFWVCGFGFIGGSAGCVADGHPLGNDGKVEIAVVVDGPLFATDLLDEGGLPAGPRQTPFESDVVLRMTEDDEVGHGAYVHVRVEPPEALALGLAIDPEGEGAQHEDGSGPTCTVIDGAFRCRGDSEGFARFSIRSAADWSGEAKLIVTWSDRVAESFIPVLPAGLPEDSDNLQLIGVGTGDVIAPTYLALSCSIDALPEDLGTKWPEGRIRAREAFVRASAPVNSPTVVENAPVVVESLSPEAALSTDETCAERTTRLRVLLNAQGESERFFTCFSDLSADVELSVTSGEKRIDPRPVVELQPEPRLLRVTVLDGQTSLEVDFSPETIWEVSAFDVALRAVPMDVDLSLDQSGTVLELTTASATLSPQDSQPTAITAIPSGAGTSRLVVRPRLLAEPSCESDLITVSEF